MDQGIPTVVRVNAKPSSIFVQETYSYSLKIQTNEDTRLVDEPGNPNRPRGLVRIDLPFDGQVYFPASTAERLSKYFHSHNQLHGVIGQLGIGEPLDWHGEWQSQVGASLLPVQIPLINEALPDPELWKADEYRAVSRFTYEPDAPHFIPLKVDMQVFDNAKDSLDEFPTTLSMLKKGNRGQTATDLLKYLNGEPLSGGQLVIELSIMAFVPSVLLQDELKVYVDELEINWPSIAPDWQLTVEPQTPSQSIQWRYDPDEQTVELSTLDLEKRPPQEGSPLTPFRCRVRYTLAYPGRMISQDEMIGKLKLRLAGTLLSGRRIAWVNAAGQREDQNSELITTETVIAATFVATLSDKFRHRKTAVYRQWIFPGVRLTPTRGDDIAAALRDIEYQILGGPEVITPGPSQNQERPGLSVGVVMGERWLMQGEQFPAKLQIQVWAVPVAAASTRREREIPDGGLVSTEMPTSDMVLQVRGQMQGSGSQLALDMEKLMSNLKNRFAVIADLR